MITIILAILLGIAILFLGCAVRAIYVYQNDVDRLEKEVAKGNDFRASLDTTISDYQGVLSDYRELVKELQAKVNDAPTPEELAVVFRSLGVTDKPVA